MFMVAGNGKIWLDVIWPEKAREFGWKWQGKREIWLDVIFPNTIYFFVMVYVYSWTKIFD